MPHAERPVDQQRAPEAHIQIHIDYLFRSIELPGMEAKWMRNRVTKYMRDNFLFLLVMHYE